MAIGGKGDKPLKELPVRAAGAKRLPLAMNHAFQYWVDAARVRIVKGRACFNPVAIAVVPGLQNVPGSGDPTTIDGYQHNKLRRKLVPLDFKVKAWGEEVAGYLIEKPIGQDLHGKPLVHYHDVWHRYEEMGGQIIQTFDQEGWDDFCVRTEKVMGAAPHTAIVSAERSRVQKSAEEHRRQAHRAPGAAAHAADLEANLEVPAAK